MLTECPKIFSSSSITRTYGDSVCPPCDDHPGIMYVIFMPHSSVMLALARIIKPPSIIFCTMAAFLEALDPTKASEPQVVLMPRLEAVVKQSCVYQCDAFGP